MSLRQRPAHLLVVDDDMLLRSLAVNTLRHAGFQVTDAASGEELPVTDGELRDVVLPARTGRALVVPPAG